MASIAFTKRLGSKVVRSMPSISSSVSLNRLVMVSKSLLRSSSEQESISNFLIRGRRDLEMLTINRVQHIRKLEILSCSEEDLNKLFEIITSLFKLTELDMLGIDLTTLDPSLLVNAILAIKAVGSSSCDS